MAYIKWGFWLAVWLVFGTVMEYSLPQYDVVRIVDTFENGRTSMTGPVFSGLILTI